MSETTLITSRDRKGRHAVGLFEVAYDQAQLDEERAQRLNERGDELQAAIARAIAELSQPNRFAHEVTTSSYTYPPGYHSVPLLEQVQLLGARFGLETGPALERCDTLVKSVRLMDDESWGAVVLWEQVAKTYGESVERMLVTIADTRPLTNYRKDQLGDRYLRQHERTVAMLRRAASAQSGPILLLPIQFGIRHAGSSVRRAREIFLPTEFGLGAFETGGMLLTHPARLGTGNELWLHCAGDEYAPEADGRFVHAPCFFWRGGELKFFTSGVSYFGPYYGSVSVRLPE